MGVVPQLDNLDIDVTVEENLAVFARLYRVKDVGAAVDRTLEIARLTDRRKDAVDKLSGGMRRRLLLARGLQTKQIARTLGIAVKTADRHIQNAYGKAGVSTRAAATLFAMEHGLVAWGELPISPRTPRS